MTHSCVLVIGDDIDKQLRPFRIFEARGEEDEFVVEVDVTEDLRSQYASRADTKVRRDADGALFEEFDPRFFRPMTPQESEAILPIVSKHWLLRSGIHECEGLGRVLYETRCWEKLGDADATEHDIFFGEGQETRVYEIPAGYTEVEIPLRDCMTFAQFIADHYGGYPELELGKERSGAHKYHYAVVDPQTRAIIKVVDRTNPNGKWDHWVVGGRWSGFFPVKAGREGVVWHGVPDWRTRLEEVVEAAILADDAQDLINMHGGRVQFDGAMTLDGTLLPRNKPAFDPRRAAHLCVEDVDFERDPIDDLIPFAVVRDGVWQDLDQVGEDEWRDIVQKLYRDLPPQTRLTIVDCHR